MRRQLTAIKVLLPITTFLLAGFIIFATAYYRFGNNILPNTTVGNDLLKNSGFLESFKYYIYIFHVNVQSFIRIFSSGFNYTQNTTSDIISVCLMIIPGVLWFATSLPMFKDNKKASKVTTLVFDFIFLTAILAWIGYSIYKNANWSTSDFDPNYVSSFAIIPYFMIITISLSGLYLIFTIWFAIVCGGLNRMSSSSATAFGKANKKLKTPKMPKQMPKQKKIKKIKNKNKIKIKQNKMSNKETLNSINNIKNSTIRENLLKQLGEIGEKENPSNNNKFSNKTQGTMQEDFSASKELKRLRAADKGLVNPNSNSKKPAVNEHLIRPRKKVSENIAQAVDQTKTILPSRTSGRSKTNYKISNEHLADPQNLVSNSEAVWEATKKSRLKMPDNNKK